MWFLKTDCKSRTGLYLYSDQWFKWCGCGETPALNAFAQVPIIGMLSGWARCLLALVHITIHLISALFTGRMGHLAHAAKGVAEFLRGLLEATPFIGRFFSNLYNGRILTPTHTCASDPYHCNFFLVKLYNPNEPDFIDKSLQEEGKHPLLPKDSK